MLNNINLVVVVVVSVIVVAVEVVSLQHGLYVALQYQPIDV